MNDDYKKSRHLCITSHKHIAHKKKKKFAQEHPERSGVGLRRVNELVKYCTYHMHELTAKGVIFEKLEL